MVTSEWADINGPAQGIFGTVVCGSTVTARRERGGSHAPGPVIITSCGFALAFQGARAPSLWFRRCLASGIALRHLLVASTEGGRGIQAWSRRRRRVVPSIATAYGCPTGGALGTCDPGNVCRRPCCGARSAWVGDASSGATRGLCFRIKHNDKSKRALACCRVRGRAARCLSTVLQATGTKHGRARAWHGRLGRMKSCHVAAGATSSPRVWSTTCR